MIPSWAPMYSWWILDGTMKKLRWEDDSLGKPSDKVAGLVIYIALVMISMGVLSGGTVKITYTRLSELTGLSRDLIRRGTGVLVAIGVINVERDGRNNIYKIVNASELKKGGWCKIPVKHLLNENGKSIDAFKELKLRKKVELHALKIFLYLAAIRENHTEYSQATYPTIRNAVGVPDRDISRALTLLQLVGLLQRVSTEKVENGKLNEPNKYYLRGYTSFTR
ncbi:TPA: hypothetical protein ACS7ZY_003670 [Providencia alcalifaciens]